MSERKQKLPALLTLLALAGCATLPSGPSVLVLPAPGKPFEVFQADDLVCRHWAESQLGTSAQDTANKNVASGAAAGTVLGAAAGALIGAGAGNAGAGAAIGGGSGMLLGTASGSGNAQSSGYEAQRRYDNSYIQCMYAKGNQIPGRVAPNYRPSRSTPPPPSGHSAPQDNYPSVPPDYNGQ